MFPYEPDCAPLIHSVTHNSYVIIMRDCINVFAMWRTWHLVFSATDQTLYQQARPWCLFIYSSISYMWGSTCWELQTTICTAVWLWALHCVQTLATSADVTLCVWKCSWGFSGKKNPQRETAGSFVCLTCTLLLCAAQLKNVFAKVHRRLCGNLPSPVQPREREIHSPCCSFSFLFLSLCWPD